MGKIYFPDKHTPEEWRAMAQECYKREAESFERSDTDGFLSQWASTVTARLYSTLADVAENDGNWTFQVLADADGNVIEGAREVKTRFGWSWVLPDGSWFNPSRAQNDEKRQATDLAKGFQFIDVEKPAVVTMAEGGLWGCYPVVLPKRNS